VQGILNVSLAHYFFTSCTLDSQTHGVHHIWEERLNEKALELEQKRQCHLKKKEPSIKEDPKEAKKEGEEDTFGILKF